MGSLGVEWSASDFWVIDTAYFALPKRRDFDLKYFYYLVKYIGLNHLKDGTSNPSLSRESFYVQLFPNPPLFEQNAVVRILDSLDNKIGLNHRMNQTLEAMARAIFKSWFVEFGPVGKEHHLFPDSFQESSMGRIPAGWTRGQLEDLLILQRGFDLPAGERKLGPYPVVAASGPIGFHDEAMAKGPGVITGRSGVLGRVFLMLEDFWPLNTSLWVKEFRRSRPAHAYFTLQSLDFSMFNAGSAVPTLNRNHIHNLPVVVPPFPVVEAFESVAMPMFELQRKNEEQSKNLVSIRDALLPKLLSGEIRVKQAEKIVGNVV